MKIVLLVCALFALISVINAVIPPNCLPCLTDQKIICHEPGKPNCKVYLTNISGGSTNLSDYALWRKFTCSDLQSGYNSFCIAKLVSGDAIPDLD